MVYNWEVTINGKKCMVEAGKVYTALYRSLINYKDLISGNITFKRLESIKRIKCSVCGHSYQDTPQSKKHHFEIYYFHREAVKNNCGVQKI